MIRIYAELCALFGMWIVSIISSIMYIGLTQYGLEKDSRERDV